eukprot:CAMPEP_0206145184 /NCGR_PEP_ID=MMETSP1473-20131121/26594_1 /ASSEMBLY_ACC=CAM_ASM_001109 /TAXON_ID=1461547 /ORGANISM="Stichococcus sp, Strain RCC1054" /LENGTH=141 /DNA_ID=CAMNT_0053541287 /DNA_START=168 /DNA_END=593 /DNA_ORIENTATION=-
MQPRSLLTRELTRMAGSADAQRSSALMAGMGGLSQQKHSRAKSDSRSQLPVAAELQAILRGHVAGEDCNIYGTSPPPRDCQNALVRDAGFATMRFRPASTNSGVSCATAWATGPDTSGRSDSCGPGSYFTSPVSALGSAAA